MGWREDRAERVRKIRQAKNRARTINEEATAQAEARWRAGYLIPARITQVLDMRGLYGPEVDEACGVEEPTVDQWEAGEVYPTWEQVLALSALTGHGPIWFTDAIPYHHIERMFICDRTKRSGSGLVVSDPPILRFSREALAAHRERLAAE